MKLLNLLLAVLFTVAFAACGNDAAEQTQPPAATPAETAPASNKISVTPKNITTTEPILNPEHGQPGHRCDIAVGAPLDGTATPATQTQVPLTPVSSPLTTPAQTQKPVAAGTNPPHGQPGHRCDIAVGAPLPEE